MDDFHLQSVKPAMKHVSRCLKELLTHLNELDLFKFLWIVLLLPATQILFE